jgi:hypothetical protein
VTQSNVGSIIEILEYQIKEEDDGNTWDVDLNGVKHIF